MRAVLSWALLATVALVIQGQCPAQAPSFVPTNQCVRRSLCKEQYCANKMECYRDNLVDSLHNCQCPSALKRRIGYIAGWSRSRSCDAFCIENINPYLYTDLHFSFAQIDGNALIVPAHTTDIDLYDKLNSLKRINPLLRTHISVGGWAFGYPPTDVRFPFAASTQVTRAAFAQSIVDFLRKYGFNGVEINWLYPGFRGGSQVDLVNLVEMVKEIRNWINNSNQDYKLSIAIPAGQTYLTYFNLREISKYVDNLNLMSYDYFGYWDTDHQVRSHIPFEYVRDTINYILYQGVPAKQLTVGLAAYGRGYTMNEGFNHTAGTCPFVCGNLPGPCTNETGVLSYKEIRTILEGDDSDVHVYTAPNLSYKYLVYNCTQWISYDNPSTMRHKLEYASQMCLGGLNVWSIDMEEGTDLIETTLYNNTRCGRRQCTQDVACTKDCASNTTFTQLMPQFSKDNLALSVLRYPNNNFTLTGSVPGSTLATLFNDGTGVITTPSNPAAAPRPIKWSVNVDQLYLMEGSCGQEWYLTRHSDTVTTVSILWNNTAACGLTPALLPDGTYTLTVLGV